MADDAQLKVDTLAKQMTERFDDLSKRVDSARRMLQRLEQALPKQCQALPMVSMMRHGIYQQNVIAQGDDAQLKQLQTRIEATTPARDDISVGFRKAPSGTFNLNASATTAGQQKLVEFARWAVVLISGGALAKIVDIIRATKGH